MAFAIVIFRLEAEDKAHTARGARTVVADTPRAADTAEKSVAARVRGTQPPNAARPYFAITVIVLIIIKLLPLFFILAIP